MQDMLLGAASGCAATVPMTVVMEALHRQLPAEERYPLPPREITEVLSEKVGVEDDMNERQKFALAVSAHFGMGTTMGAIYGALARSIPLPVPLAGAAFGLAVWGGNYLGILPALGILRSATDHPPRRTGLMIAAHLVWGITTAVAVEALRDKDANSEGE